MIAVVESIVGKVKETRILEMGKDDAKDEVRKGLDVDGLR